MGFETKNLWYDLETQKKYTETVTEDRKRWRSSSGLRLLDLRNTEPVIGFSFETSPVSDNLLLGNTGNSKNPIVKYKHTESNTINENKELAVPAVPTLEQNESSKAQNFKTSNGVGVPKQSQPSFLMTPEEAARKAIAGGL